MTLNDSRLLNITSGQNFRELGGYQTKTGQKIKSHKLIRSGNLANLSNKDLAFLENYGVKYVADFRSIEEAHKYPDRVPHGAQYIFDPVLSPDFKPIFKDDLIYVTDPQFGYKHMLSAYQNMVESKAYRKLFELLLANDKENEAILFHCTSGKDRTGFGKTPRQNDGH